MLCNGRQLINPNAMHPFLSRAVFPPLPAYNRMPLATSRQTTFSAYRVPSGGTVQHNGPPCVACMQVSEKSFSGGRAQAGRAPGFSRRKYSHHHDPMSVWSGSVVFLATPLFSFFGRACYIYTCTRCEVGSEFFGVVWRS